MEIREIRLDPPAQDRAEACIVTLRVERKWGLGGMSWAVVATCAIWPKVDCNTLVKSQRSEEREMAVRGS